MNSLRTKLCYFYFIYEPPGQFERAKFERATDEDHFSIEKIYDTLPTRTYNINAKHTLLYLYTCTGASELAKILDVPIDAPVQGFAANRNSVELLIFKIPLSTISMENGAKNVGSYHSDFLCMLARSLIYRLRLGVEIGCDDETRRDINTVPYTVQYETRV